MPLHFERCRPPRGIKRDKVPEMIRAADLFHTASLHCFDVLGVISTRDPLNRKSTAGDPHHQECTDGIAMA